jgi:outer membrane protein TolC
MKKIGIILIVLLSQSINAQEKNWTLEECIQYAVEHNPQRMKQEAQNEIYRQDQREAIGGFIPSLHVASRASVNFGRGLDPETNTYISSNTFSNAYEISSSVSLFDGLSQIYRAKMAKINRLRGEEQLQETKDRIALETMELYFNVLYYKGTVGLARQQLEESEANLRRMQRMEELGLRSIPDLTEIQAKEAEDRFLLTRQTNMLELEIIKLKAKMNYPVTGELSIEAYEPIVLTGRTGETAEDVFRQATATLPRLRASEKAMSAMEMQYKVARGRLFPSLSLNAGVSTGFSRMMDGTPYVPFEEQLKNRRGSYVALTLSIPVFDRFSRSSEMKRSKQRFVIAQNENEELIRQVYGEIEQAVADVNGLSDECLFARKRTEAMFSAHQVNQRKYEEGLIDALELSTSANRLLNSQIEEIYTHLKYQLKYKLLQYYKGGTSWTYY